MNSKHIFLCIIDVMSFQSAARLSILSRSHLQIIREREWHNEIYLGRCANIDHVCYLLDTYRLKNVNLSEFCRDINFIAPRLSMCHTVNAFDTNLNNDGLRQLSSAEKLVLTWTKVTRDGLVHARKWRNVDLSCLGIADDDLVHLADCHSVTLRGNRVTDRGLVHLLKVHTLDLTCNPVTDEGVRMLVDCKNLMLIGASISQETIDFLKLRGVNVITN